MWNGIDPGSGELHPAELLLTARPAGPGSSRGPTRRRRPTLRPIPRAVTTTATASASCSTPSSAASETTRARAAWNVFPPAPRPTRSASGDVLIARGTQNGTPVEYAASVGFVYASFPVVASYDDGLGDSADPLRIRVLPTPAAVFHPGPLPVRAGPNGQVVLKLAFWRPQRLRIEGEPGSGKWMDVGNLVYGTACSPAPPKASSARRAATRTSIRT